MIDLSVNLAGIRMKNPVMPASGTFDAECFAQIAGFSIDELGAIVTKGTTLERRKGNAQPRSIEVNAGLINYIGLQNLGVDKVVREKLPLLLNYNTPVIVNVCGGTVEEYAEVATRLENGNSSGVICGLEVNISCPNLDPKKGGLAFGMEPTMAAEVTSAVRRRTRLPIIVKLTPNVTSVIPIAKAVIDAGADALSLCNTFKARKKVWSNPDRGKYVMGGQSGRGIMPIALRIVYELASADLGKPIIGIGGIATVFDAIEFLESGSTAIQVGTASFPDALAMMHIIRDLRLYIEASGCQSLQEWRTKGFPMPSEKDMPRMA